MLSNGRISRERGGGGKRLSRKITLVPVKEVGPGRLVV